MSWFTRLFRRQPTLVGQRVHAWHFSEWGRARVEGEVVCEDARSLTLDISNPTAQDFRAYRLVWRHDMRPLNEPLPVYTE